MIDSNLLRELGWSEELITAAEQTAKQVGSQQASVAETRIQVLPSVSVETSTTINIPKEAAALSVWPRF